MIPNYDGHELYLTHIWITSQLQTIGRNTDGLRIERYYKTLQRVYFNGRLLFDYNYSNGHTFLPDGAKYKPAKGLLYLPDGSTQETYFLELLERLTGK